MNSTLTPPPDQASRHVVPSAQPSPDNAYDTVPYSSHPFRQSTPERLATIATLLGLTPRPLESCRVLELGCSSGGNLLPLAEQFPGSTFLGIDGSAKQIAQGQAMLDRLDVANVRLEHRNILDISAERDGQFDYIITHGVYSWVPQHVQDKMLAICRENLAPNGVAYISYNTYPGWHMRGIIRDMMLFRSKSFERPEDRVRQARGVIDFLAKSVSAENSPYGMLLRNELEMLADQSDYYLFHEHLEDHNEPLYFHQFAARVAEKGLQYLGEADFHITSMRSFSPQVQTVLRSVSSDLIEQEQYMDFLRNRMFRQTLLCHAEARVDRTPSPERLLNLYVSAKLKPQTPLVDVRSRAEAVFEGPHATTKSTEPIVKSALLHLGQIWPKAMRVSELIAFARSQLAGGSVVVDTSQMTADSRRLAEPLLRCYETRQVELSVSPPRHLSDLSDRPQASKMSRLMAEKDSRVTNLRHESVNLSDMERHVLRLMDGKNDRGQILEALAALVQNGSLLLRHDGKSLSDGTQIQNHLAEPLEGALRSITRQSLLVA